MRMLKIVALLSGVTLVLAGCGSSGDEATPSTATVTTTSQTTNSETTATDTEPAGPTVVRIVVVNAAPNGGIVRKSVDKGDRVVLVVKSDVADEVHLHGYDITRDVAAGGVVRMAFTAKLPGRFEVELEDRGVQIADLTVEP